MKITLYLFFRGNAYGKKAVLLKKRWPISDHESPFWRKDEETKQWVYLGCPSSGDIHRVEPSNKEKSHFILLIQSHQTDTFEKIIWAEVKEVIDAKTNTVVLGFEERVIQELREDHWEDASEEERNRFSEIVKNSRKKKKD
jgi:hypothetical protein